MYESFFGLREQPFGLTPNTHFFMNSLSHAQALEMLLVGLRTGEGFLKVTGEVGTGKTLICRMLLNSLEAEYVSAYIPNPSCSPETLYCLLADELTDAPQTCLSQHMSSHIDDYFNSSMTNEVHMRALQKIQEKLLLLAAQDKRVVLIIDEAQSMPRDTIEALRLISNLETESQKLIQIVLFGQPELDERLAQDNLRQLAQRISFHYRLQPLSEQLVSDYVAHRVRQAGRDDGNLFTSAAITALAKASKGVPRLINILCHKALLLTYGQGLALADRPQVMLAIKDTPSISPVSWVASRPLQKRWLAFFMLLPVGGVWVAEHLSVLL
jgi:MSHA biogenesis protein MshM